MDLSVTDTTRTMVRMTHMSDKTEQFAVRVPRRHQGIPAGAAAAASSREPASLAAIEAAAFKGAKEDPERVWEWVQFGPTPLPASTVTQQRATNPERGPHDLAQLENVQKTVYNSASWRACKLERTKGGKLLPAEKPTVFATEADAQTTLERYHRLGCEVGVPMAGHLGYGVVAPMQEWEATAGQSTADRERQQLQAEVRIEALEARAREVAEALEQARAEQERVSPAVDAGSDWHRHPSEPQIQQRIRSDGSKVFRARVAGRVSPTGDSVERAIDWRDRELLAGEAVKA